MQFRLKECLNLVNATIYLWIFFSQCLIHASVIRCNFSVCIQAFK